MELILLIGNIELVSTFALSVVFMVVYHLLARWWVNEMGRNLMALALAVGGVTGLGVVRLIFGAGLDVGWFAGLRVAVFGATPLVLAWRIWIVIHTWRQGRDPLAKDSHHNEPPPDSLR